MGTKSDSLSGVGEWVRLYSRMAYRVAFRLTGDSGLAEDLVQDVFLKLIKMPTEKREEIQHISAYIKTMVVSIGYDYIRKKTRLRECSMVDDDIDMENLSGNPHHSDPHHWLTLKRELERFQQALAFLPKQEAEVFTLRFIEELSYREIARQMGISENLVGVALHRAQRKLVEKLGNLTIYGDS